MEEGRPLFVINPAAGQGRAERVVPLIRSTVSRSAEIVTSASLGDAEDLACKGAAEGYSPVVAVGGDGTVHAVVNGLMRAPRKASLGIVPVGNGNDLRRTLGLPGDPAASLRLICSGVGGEIDVGICNDRYFLNVGGMGLDTRVAMAVNRRSGRFSRGRLPYILHGLSELSRYENPEFTLQLDDRVLTARSLLIAVANARFFGGGMMICPQADLTDGLLDVCVAGDLTRLEALTLLPKLFFGAHVNHPKVSFHQVRMARIETPAGLEVQLDGEIVSSLPAEFRIANRALRLAGWGG